jgi:hypothetical protein
VVRVEMVQGAPVLREGLEELGEVGISMSVIRGIRPITDGRRGRRISLGVWRWTGRGSLWMDMDDIRRRELIGL